MTRKTPRAAQIRKLTADDIKLLERVGGMVNDQVPPSALKEIQHVTSLDAEKFAAYLGEQLAIYRERSDAAELQIPVADSIRYASETLEIIEELTLRMQMLPELVEGLAAVAALRRGASFDDTRRRLVDDLRIASDDLSAGVNEAAKFSGGRGAKPKEPRNDMVHNVVRKLREMLPPATTQARAVEICHRLLTACCVAVPADLAEFGKLVKRSKGNIHP